MGVPFLAIRQEWFQIMIDELPQDNKNIDRGDMVNEQKRTIHHYTSSPTAYLTLSTHKPHIHD